MWELNSNIASWKIQIVVDNKIPQKHKVYVFLFEVLRLENIFA